MYDFLKDININRADWDYFSKKINCQCTLEEYLIPERSINMKPILELSGEFNIKEVGHGYYLEVKGGSGEIAEIIELEDVVENSTDVTSTLGDMIRKINNTLVEKKQVKKEIKQHKNDIARLRQDYLNN